MGFLDKVKGAAKTAKDELDKSGLVDKAKDKAREQWRAGTDAEHPPPVVTADATSRMVDAIRLGAVDPTTLISTAEVAAIAGRDVGPGRAGFDDSSVSASFESGAGRDFCRLSLAVWHNVDDDGPFIAQEHWDWLLETYAGDEVHLDGVGDDAFRMATTVWAMAAGRIVFADVVGDRLDDGTKAQWAEAMVRLVVPRLPPLAAS